MLVSIVVIFTVVLVAFALLLRVLMQRDCPRTYDALEWLQDFSPVSYRPMQRLLDQRDYAFLAGQTGYKPSIARDLRRQRREIFQDYLSGMIRDFHRLLGIARIIAVYAREDQAAFASKLWRLRWSFYASVAGLELRVAMSRLGIGTVDVRRLAGAMERLHLYTENVVPAAEPAS